MIEILTVPTSRLCSIGLLSFRPHLTWPADPDSLYTVMIVDNGIERVLPKQYVHWMVVNIPGNSVPLGSEVMEYVPPFSFTLRDGKLDPEGPAHPMLVMIYKQPAKVFELLNNQPAEITDCSDCDGRNP